MKDGGDARKEGFRFIPHKIFFPGTEEQFPKYSLQCTVY